MSCSWNARWMCGGARQSGVMCRDVAMLSTPADRNNKSGERERRKIGTWIASRVAQGGAGGPSCGLDDGCSGSASFVCCVLACWLRERGALPFQAWIVTRCRNPRPLYVMAGSAWIAKAGTDPLATVCRGLFRQCVNYRMVSDKGGLRHVSQGLRVSFRKHLS